MKSGSRPVLEHSLCRPVLALLALLVNTCCGYWSVLFLALLLPPLLADMFFTSLALVTHFYMFCSYERLWLAQFLHSWHCYIHVLTQDTLALVFLQSCWQMLTLSSRFLQIKISAIISKMCVCSCG